MPGVKDLTGQKFGKLTVLERDNSKKGRAAYWICQCDCGTIKSVSLNTLSAGKTLSCGCLRSELATEKNTLDITNQRFGKLVAKENTQKQNKKGEYIWRCECDCGNKAVYCTATNLKTRVTLSCGCLKESKGEYLINSLLIEHNKHFAHEYSFKDLFGIGGSLLRFDFAILDDDTNQPIRLIEFDGEQHFIPKPRFNFNTIKIHDQRKNEYTKNNNIPLIRIPYTRIKEITIETLFDNTFLV